MKRTSATVLSEDGTEIVWYDYGGSGPDVVLGHATGFCAAVWEPVIELLLPHFRCVAYDMRGHGASSSPSDRAVGFRWTNYADDLSAVLMAAEIYEPLGVGHSCGGATQVLLEEQLPGKFRGMFLYEPVIFAQDPPLGPQPERDLAVRTLKRRSSFPSIDDARTNFSTRGPFSTLDARSLEGYLRDGFIRRPDGSVELACDPRDESAVYVWAGAHTGFTSLQDVECPVEIGLGTDSTSFAVEDMEPVVDRMPHATLTEWTGLGHFGPLENPAAFADRAIIALTKWSSS